MLTAYSTYAGGSESFTNQVLPILQQNNELAKALLNSFEFSDGIYAQTRMGNHTKFGGQRLGPYTVLAKPNGSQSTWVFEVIINTKWRVFDKEGNEIPLMDENGKKSGVFDSRATRIAETFMSLEIKPYKENNSNQRVHPIACSARSG